jgi:hypothetical protein
MHITMVKKILADGTPCRKCQEVESRLRESGHFGRIDKTVIADERDPGSEGMLLAAKHRVKLAPYFIVTDDQGVETIYTVYFRFLNEVLNARSSESDEVTEIMNNQDLDYL